MLRRTSTLFLLLLVLVVMAAPALAHVDLLSTDPADGAVLTMPVERIELVFSGGIEPTEDGVRIFDVDRNPLQASAFQPTESTLVIEPEVPLTDGVYALVWQVQTPDSHVLSGSLSFAVEPPTAGSTAPGRGTTDSEAEAANPTVTTTVVPTPTAPPSDAPAGVAEAPTQEPVELLVVDEPNPTAGDWLARIGRWAVMTGALLAIGAFAFAATSLIGTQREVRSAVRWVRRGAVLLLAGTLIEVVGVSMALAGSALGAMSLNGLIDLLGGQFGVAVLLRVAGGIAMLQDPRLVVVTPGPPVADASRLPDVLGLGQTSHVATATAPSATTYRVEVQHEWVALVGMAAVAASFMFDGHTVTADAGLTARASTLVHIVSAGVWFGGVVVMANMLTRRWRASVPLDAAAVAVRFSRIAAASLVLTGLAGLALTWAIIDAPSDLISGAWGRLLLIKVALVGVAAALGGYNHFKVVPRLGSGPDETGASDLLRRVVRVEGVVLLVVVAVTAVLVGAAI